MRKVKNVFKLVGLVFVLVGCSTQNNIDLEAFLKVAYTVENQQFVESGIAYELVVENNIGTYIANQDISQLLTKVYGQYVQPELLQESNAFYMDIINLQIMAKIQPYTMTVTNVELQKIDDQQYDYTVQATVTNYVDESVTLTGRIQLQDNKVAHISMNGFDSSKITSLPK